MEVDLWGAYFPEEEEEEEDPDDDTFLIPLERVSIRSHTIWRGDEFTEPQFGWHEVRANTGDGPLLDPLGNLTFWEGPLFIAAFFAAMALDDWDETEYTEGDANGQFAFLLPSSPLPNPPPGGFQVLIYPAGYYTQKRYDTETGELIDVRRIMHAGNGWGQQVDSDTRAAIELSFWEQIVPPDEEPYELDITTQFYIGTELKSYDTAHKDAAGIWSVSAQLPERRQIASVPIKNDKGDNTQEFSTNSGKLSKLGSIIVDRAGSSTTFVPA